MGGILFFILGVAYFFYGLQPAAGAKGVPREPIPFTIAKGEGFRSIGARLSQESLIRSITVFKLYSLLAGRAQRFQPGMYELSGTMSVPQLAGVLTAGGRSDVLVVIPEGSTVKDVDAILAANGVIARGSLTELPVATLAADYPFLGGVSSFEGFLFPDTYYFSRASSPTDVARRMLDAFEKKMWPLLAGARGWYDTLTLASFLEREVKSMSDRQLVAGILLRRLALGMPLQVDATVSYAKCDGRFRDCDRIAVRREDLALASPYNTYERRGWTPTPIANPGEASVKAALTPVKSSYLYYLSARETGETHFSRTLEEHNLKRVKYL